MLKVHLCENCKKELQHYNPYVDKDGKIIPIDKLTIEIVSEEKCDNYTVNGKFVNLKMTNMKEKATLKEGDTVNVIGTTLCGGFETECIPIGTICKIVHSYEEKGKPVFGIVSAEHGSFYRETEVYWYLGKDLEKMDFCAGFTRIVVNE